jgi:hypothetical protein
MNARNVRFVRVAAVLPLCLGTSTAAAGHTVSTPVVVNLTGGGNGSASGSLASARHATDSSEYIGCVVYQSTGSNFAECYAEDSKKNFLNCATNDPNMVAAAMRVNDTSWLSFSVVNGSTCNALAVDNSSAYIH